MTRVLLIGTIALTGCATTLSSAIIRTNDTAPRPAVAVEHVQIVAANDLEGCIPLGRIGVLAERPALHSPRRYEGVQTLREAAAELGADEVRDIRFADVSDRGSATSVTGLACARAPTPRIP